MGAGLAGIAFWVSKRYEWRLADSGCADCGEMGGLLRMFTMAFGEWELVYKRHTGMLLG